jgi:Dyp-type peroxidase family
MSGERGAAVAPVEPVLELSDIQGAAVPGFLKPYQTLIGINCRATSDDVKKFKVFIRAISDEIAKGSETLADRREHRKLKLEDRADNKKPVAFVAIAFTYAGLRKLTPGAAAIPGDAFRLGLAKRSLLLGDPADPSAEGNPTNWRVGGSKGELDALIIVAGDHPDIVKARSDAIRKQLAASDVVVSYCEAGAIRHDKDMKGHEHFGFDDGVSQPGIRGRASEKDTDFITDRHVAPSETPAAWLYGYPGQDLVWPGELVLGYPATSPDPLVPGPPSPTVPEWTRNGSFLVFRRLRQDVGLFWRTMKEEAHRLSSKKGFEKLTDERLAALLVGRWLSGAPVNRTPEHDIPELGKSTSANNHFRFDSDTLPLPLVSGERDDFPKANADPAGLVCPWAAHIKKVNTRDSGSDMGARDSTYRRRVLRVGIPFGKPLADKYGKPEDDSEHGNRGLLFLCIQSSIEDQFEFLCSRWANDPARPKMPGGHDFVIGQNSAPGEQQVRKCALFGADFAAEEVSTDKQWVIPTGGGYFFLPSIRTLRNVLSA